MESSSSIAPPGVEARLTRFFELHDLAIELALAGLKHGHPDASDTELQHYLKKRLDKFREDKWMKHG